jgi:hypothetical protein
MAAVRRRSVHGRPIENLHKELLREICNFVLGGGLSPALLYFRFRSLADD